MQYDFDFNCPRCGKELHALNEWVGKTARCDSCQHRFVVSRPEQNERRDSGDQPSESRLEPREKPALPVSERPPRLNPVMAAMAEYGTPPTPVHRASLIPVIPEREKAGSGYFGLSIAACLITAVLGYAVGLIQGSLSSRPPVQNLPKTSAANVAPKQETGPAEETGASSVSAVPEAFQPEIPQMPQEETSRARPPKDSSPAPEEPAAPKPLVIGEAHNSESLQIVLLNARIDRPKGKDIFGSVGVIDEPYLIFDFSITNSDDRKILRYRDSGFFSNKMQLTDDVGNVIRRIDYSLGMTKPVGALTGDEDIMPGQRVGHLALFAIPPPKTEYLLLTVNLEVFGVEGTVQFKILTSQIDGFSAHR